MFVPWKKSYDKPRQHIKKQRHHFTDKGLCSQSYVFSSSHYGCESSTIKRLSVEELMLLNCAGEDSWGSLGLQGNQITQSSRKSTLNIPWKDLCRSWSSNALAIWCEELTHWEKNPDAGKDWVQKEKGMTEDEMVGWHHWHNDLSLSTFWEIAKDK